MFWLWLYITPELVTQPNVKYLICLLKHLVTIICFGLIWIFFPLCLTDTLTMIYFLHCPPTFTRAKLWTLNIFSKVPCGQKVINFASRLDINWYGLVRKPRRAIPSRSIFFVPALSFDCRRFIILSPLYFFPCRFILLSLHDLFVATWTAKEI